MITQKENIDTNSIEVDETNGRVAKMVKASDFHSDIAGSGPVAITRISVMNWLTQKDIITKGIKAKGNDFNCIAVKDFTGRTRVSVLQ